METMEVGASASGPSRKPASRSGAKASSSSGSLLTEGRFFPGRLLAERYRIVALLGKGGMGEVYRADDLTLGQPVALKFLPEEAIKDESALERFRNEVRVARRVSHPNVCRVYDLGEVDAQTFFTMEYVDGEDLASLLRRIGRLPADKALEIARQLCAGLAAAHAKGVLHRDLKPANIMLDGRGQVVVTDFGLAGLAEQIVGPDVRSGTPAYMSPEQLAGKEVTVKSDIYSLGLVLYEIFTGKRAFDIESLPELVRARSESAPSRPSTLVKDLDPAVERVILRCLEADPALRPDTVLNVAAALPGSDPLAAALAAGETPSPQMVAAAGKAEGLAPRTALLCLAAFLAGLSLYFYLAIKTSGMGKLGLDQSPEILSAKARDITAQLGYPIKPVDAAYGFSYNSDFLDYVRKKEQQHNWDEVFGGRPGMLAYWYRQSPRYLDARDFHNDFLTPGIVTPDDPPPVLSGMINLVLDVNGRLTLFQAIPPEREEAITPAAAANWNPLFAAAGLDLAQFQSATPIWNSLAVSDMRVAWTGKWPGTDRPLRIEAASFHDKPVFFSLIGPWTIPHRMESEQSKPGRKAANLLLLAIVLSVVVGASLLARRNYKQGRGDRRGAFRSAGMIFLVAIALWLCQGHLVPSLSMIGRLFLTISTGLLISCITWLLYLSVEPYVRRHWPQTMISWSRLLMGQMRDPLVGRDVLLGLVLGVVWLLIIEVRFLLTVRAGAPPDVYSTDYLVGSRFALGAWLSHIPGSIQGTLVFFFLLFVLRVLLRKEWLAGIAFVAIWATRNTLLGSDYILINVIAWALLYAVAAVTIFRIGFVALATTAFITDLVGNVPLTLDVSAWYFGNTLLPVLSVVALAFWGFYTALAGQKLWNTDAFS